MVDNKYSRLLYQLAVRFLRAIWPAVCICVFVYKPSFGRSYCVAKFNPHRPHKPRASRSAVWAAAPLYYAVLCHTALTRSLKSITISNRKLFLFFRNSIPYFIFELFIFFLYACFKISLLPHSPGALRSSPALMAIRTCDIWALRIVHCFPPVHFASIETF